MTANENSVDPYCYACNKEFSGSHQYNVHLASKHGDVLDNIGEKLRQQADTPIPETMYVSLTYDSPLYNRAYPYYHADTEEAGSDYWLDVFRKYEHVQNIVLTGGEPTIHPDFREILDYATTYFNNVTVETEGLTRTVLSKFDCTVAVRLEYFKSRLNNNIKRRTDPRVLDYNPTDGRLEYSGDYYMCTLCNDTTAQPKIHMLEHHRDTLDNLITDEIRGQIQAEMGVTVDTLDDVPVPVILNSPVFDPVTPEYEDAFNWAYRKLQAVDNPVQLRGHVYNDNDVQILAQLAERHNADSRFVPVPAYDTRGISQVRWEHLLGEVAWMRQYNDVSKHTHTIDMEWPHVYQRPQWQDQYGDSSWGRNQFHVTPDGYVTPSQYDLDTKITTVLNNANDKVYNKVHRYRPDTKTG